MADLPYAFDDRGNVGEQRVIHALIIGISEYDNLPSLGAGVHTAAQIFKALKSANAGGFLPASLATVTLLFSPTEAEEQELIRNSIFDWADATDENIRAARYRFYEQAVKSEVGSGNKGADYCFYYFGGHGIDMFRADPIALAKDADPTLKPWKGAIDQLEFREFLTTIYRSDRRQELGANFLFFYDCCRIRENREIFQDAVKLQFDRVNDIPIASRKYCVLFAAEQGFESWEPSSPIKINPELRLPLSYFGHAFLNAFHWSTDYCVDPQYQWIRTTAGLADDVYRALNELTGQDGYNEPIAGGPANMASSGAFPILRSRKPPKISVLIKCEPVELHYKHGLGVSRRVGSNFQPEIELSSPWPQHPFCYDFMNGQYKLRCNELTKVANLRPVITNWKWVIGHDDITIYDPSNRSRD